MKGIKHSGLYEFQGETMTDCTSKTSDAFVQEFELWLGYIGKRNLNILRERNMLCGYITNELNVYMCYNLDQR